jgi:hypothetical protein
VYAGNAAPPPHHKRNGRTNLWQPNQEGRPTQPRSAVRIRASSRQRGGPSPFVGRNCGTSSRKRSVTIGHCATNRTLRSSSKTVNQRTDRKSARRRGGVWRIPTPPLGFALLSGKGFTQLDLRVHFQVKRVSGGGLRDMSVWPWGREAD